LTPSRPDSNLTNAGQVLFGFDFVFNASYVVVGILPFLTALFISTHLTQSMMYKKMGRSLL
jgi:hypothetical protein